MNLLGKVFTALILALSLIFFLLAVAVNNEHIKNKDKADTATAAQKKAESDLNQAQVQIQSLQNKLAIERAARVATLGTLEAANREMKSQRDKSNREALNLSSALTAATETNKANAIELKARDDENKALRADLLAARADRDQLFGRLVAATDSLGRLEGRYSELNVKANLLADENTKSKSLIDSLGIDPDTVLSPPATNGLVVAVDGTNVEVNLGRDDGLAIGDTIEVSRNSNYLGRLQIATVRNDKAVARILESYQRGYIRSGDRVDTQLEISITRKR